MDAIRTLLKASLPGTVPVEFGALPAGSPFPAVVLNIVSETAHFTQDGESDLHRYVLQLDAYALTFGGAESLYRQAHAVMQPPLASLQVARRSREGGTDEAIRPYRVSADYLVFHAIS